MHVWKVSPQQYNNKLTQYLCVCVCRLGLLLDIQHCFSCHANWMMVFKQEPPLLQKRQQFWWIKSLFFFSICKFMRKLSRLYSTVYLFTYLFSSYLFSWLYSKPHLLCLLPWGSGMHHRLSSMVREISAVSPPRSLQGSLTSAYHVLSCTATL